LISMFYSSKNLSLVALIANNPWQLKYLDR